MRPLRLQIKGFGAFREETEVDFAGIDLLALVGPTGSGKSTLIDAIAFALYGSVVRYDDKRAVAPAVNQLSAEARVRLDFELSGSTYTAVRVIRRTAAGATTKEARLETADQVLASNAKELTEVVTDLLGLDFDRFVKTVVLPQGRFAGFLHDTPSQRQDLLRDLLGIGVYERMGRLARTRAKDTAIRVDTLDGQLAGRSVLDDAEFAALEAEVAAVSACRPVLDDLLIEIDRAAEVVAASRREFAALDELVAAAGAISVPDDVAVLADRLASARGVVDELTRGVADATAAREAADAAVTDGPDRDRLRALVERYERLNELAVELEELGTGLVTAEAAATQAAAAATEAEAEGERLRAAVAAAVSVADDAAAVRDAGPARSTVERWQQIRTDRAALAAQLTDADEVVAAASAALTKAEHERDLAEAAWDCAQLALDMQRRSAVAADLAAHLVAGEECPVCRREIDDVPAHAAADGLAQATADLQQATAARDAASARLGEHQTDAVAADTRRVALADRGAEIDLLLVDVPEAADLDRLARDAVRLDGAAAEAAEAVRRAQTAVADHERSAEVAASRARRTEADAVLADIRSRLAVKEHDRAALVADLGEAPGQADLLAELADADVRLERQTQARHGETAARSALASAVAERDELVAAERAQRATFDAARHRLVVLDPPVPVYESVADDWAELLAWASEQRRSLTARRDEAQAAVPVAEAGQAVLVDKAVQLVTPHVGGSDAASGDAARESDDPRRLAIELARVSERLINRLGTAAREREERQTQMAEIEALRVDQQVAAELGRLLDPRAFEHWLMEEIIEDLVGRATGRLLALTGGRYGLHRSDKNDFDVIDHHNAGERRDVKTLSGGETFLASLALALGLADALSELSEKSAPALESIFLDEGFGTLDVETLDVVAAAIEELGATGRMVGIVTHIPDLAERMPVRFEVQRGLDSSRVERVEV